MIKITQPGKMRWAWRVTHWGGGAEVNIKKDGKYDRRYNLVDLDVDGDNDEVDLN